MLYNEATKQLLEEMMVEFGKKTKLLDVVEELKKRAKEQNIA